MILDACKSIFCFYVGLEPEVPTLLLQILAYMIILIGRRARCSLRAVHKQPKGREGDILATVLYKGLCAPGVIMGTSCNEGIFAFAWLFQYVDAACGVQLKALLCSWRPLFPQAGVPSCALPRRIRVVST